MEIWHFNSQPHKEADIPSPEILLPGYYFNSQPHKEADGKLGGVWSVSSISTHSLTRRLTAYIFNCFIFLNFNSQPHKEADSLSDIFITPPLHFNSQPHKEADVFYVNANNVWGIFQLTASQGGWQTACRKGVTAWIFQLTASQGGWPVLLLSLPYSFLFQLTASQGGWQD